MKIELINESNIDIASIIFFESWQYSHKEIITREFCSSFTPERHKGVLQQHIEKGIIVLLVLKITSQWVY